MRCKTHMWDFHAELTDGTIIRWCGQCGGLQTYSKSGSQNLGLGFDQAGFTKYAPTEIRYPEVAVEDDGLVSEGVVQECQPELRTYSSYVKKNFDRPWEPDDQGKLVEPPQIKHYGPPCLSWRMEKEEQVQQYEEMTVLAGINNNSCDKKDTV